MNTIVTSYSLNGMFHPDQSYYVLNLGTTRQPREGERDGVDYKFISVDEFKSMDKKGELLESGMYENNHYGTPKPPSDPPSHAILPGYSRTSASSGYSPREPMMPSTSASVSMTQVRILLYTSYYITPYYVISYCVIPY